MGGNTITRSNKTGVAENEIQPPQKSKRKVSVSKLFEQQGQKRARHDDITSSITQANDASEQSEPSAKRVRRSKAVKEHPLFKDFQAATYEYRSGVAAYKAQLLEPVYDELVARVDAVDADGQSQESNRFKPLEEEVTIVRHTRKDGTAVISDVKLGDAMKTFQKLLDRKRAEMESLLEELDAANDEIDTTMKDITAVENREVKQAKRDLDAALSSTANEAQQAKEATLLDVKTARKDDHTANVEAKRVLEKALKPLIDLE